MWRTSFLSTNNFRKAPFFEKDHIVKKIIEQKRYVMNRVRQMIGLKETEACPYTGKNVGVAVLDSGIMEHPDFDNRIVAFHDFVRGSGRPYDDNGHGTHIAGIIGGNGSASAGKYIGIAPKCHFVVGKVLDRRGDGSIRHILDGISWVIKNRVSYGIRILNISVGMSSATRAEDQQKLIDYVEEAWDAGIAVVCAAGNNGPARESVTVPGSSPMVITVGSEDDRHISDGGRRLRPGYSGRGPTKDCVLKPEVLAPGTGIYSCSNSGGYTRKTGTSMAVPVVSGAIALLLEKYPHMQPVDIKLRLYERCIPLRTEQQSEVWGRVFLPYLLI